MIVTVVVLCLQLSVIQSAPMQLQLLPFQNLLPMQSQLSMQQQMALQQMQQLQAMQRFNAIQSSVMANPTRPLLILLPNAQESNIQENTKTIINDRYDNRNENEQKQSDGIHGVEDEETDSIVIDAADTVRFQPKRAILLLPNNGRFSIGEFISSIPFLPFEINVPDSISWIYNGIAGIIGGIGQRLPFRPQKPSGQDQVNLKINLDKMQTIQNGLPFFMMPLDAPMLPMQA